MTITDEQFKVTRHLLSWSQAGRRQPKKRTLYAIHRALEVAGVELTRGVWGQSQGRAASKNLAKARQELSALVTAGLKRSSECRKVTGVTINHVVRIGDDRPNWHASFAMTDKVAVPAIALQIVGDLAAEFDLV
jgi:hypothetical protein